MRKRKIIVMLLVPAAVVVAIIYLLPPREPVYEGEPLSYWLKGYDPVEGSEPGRQKADEVMREAGTNAIPTLLRMLREHDSPWKLKLIALARKQHFITIRYVGAERQNVQAWWAFEELGSDGKAALPDLMEIYQTNPSASSQYRISGIFASIGPAARPAIPMLLRSVTSTDHSTRAGAVQALGRIHSEPEKVVPALIVCLHDPNQAIRAWTLTALGEFGPDAKEAVPALIEAVRGPDRALSSSAYGVLQEIDAEAAARVMAENQQAVK